MRLFSWAGCAALATAAGLGYLANEVTRPGPSAGPELSIVGLVEESEAGAGASPVASADSAEVIDLTCLPIRMPDDIYRHTAEPPLADAAATPDIVRTVHFEVPAAPEDGPELPPAPLTMPHLKDDDAPPAKLPPMIDDDPESAKQPAPPSGPIWEAVWKFVGDAAPSDVTVSRFLTGPHPAACEVGPERGKPPVGEQPPTPEVGGDAPRQPAAATQPHGPLWDHMRKFVLDSVTFDIVPVTPPSTEERPDGIAGCLDPLQLWEIERELTSPKAEAGCPCCPASSKSSGLNESGEAQEAPKPKEPTSSGEEKPKG